MVEHRLGSGVETIVRTLHPFTHSLKDHKLYLVPPQLSILVSASFRQTQPVEELHTLKHCSKQEQLGLITKPWVLVPLPGNDHRWVWI